MRLQYIEKEVMFQCRSREIAFQGIKKYIKNHPKEWFTAKDIYNSIFNKHLTTTYMIASIIANPYILSVNLANSNMYANYLWKKNRTSMLPPPIEHPQKYCTMTYYKELMGES